MVARSRLRSELLRRTSGALLSCWQRLVRPVNLSALNPQEQAELVQRLEARQQYQAASIEERERLIRKAQLESSFAQFFREAWPLLEPGKALDWSWHYELIAEYLEIVYRREIRRLIINVPPRTAKSTEATICWPAWCWARNQALRFLTGSYSKDLSVEHSVKRRGLIDSNWFRQFWPITFAEDTNRRDQYRNASQGEMIATSVGATGTGRGGDILLLDDGLSADQAKSEAERKTAHGWFMDTFRTRLNDPAIGAIVVIEQRTHEEDLTGWLLKNEPGQWTHLRIPLEAEEREVWKFPISGRVIERQLGDVLQPSRFTPEVMASRKIHARTYATQDQQRPAPDGGVIFRREWWKYYKTPPAKFDRVITSWDFAVEGKADSDFNVGICLGQVGADIYLLDMVRARIPFPEQKRALKSFSVKHPEARRHYVEKKANGPAVMASLAKEVSGLIAVDPQGSKEQRAEAASGDVEAGNVWLPEDAPWILDFVEECTIFPNGANDDQVDAVSQGINELRKARNAWLDMYGQQNAEREAQRASEERKFNPPPKPAAREWSNPIRVLAMGIAADPDQSELADWIAFCEEQGDATRAQFAREFVKGER